MVTMVRFLCLAILPATALPAVAQPAGPPMTIVTLTDPTADSPLIGRVLVRARDGGLLLEDRSGVLWNLTPDRIRDQKPADRPWSPLPADELATVLIRETGPGFTVTTTPHFLLCSRASDVFTEYCGDLMEHVYEKYFDFWKERSVTVATPDRMLPVIVFARQEDLAAHMRRCHPELPPNDSPGFYSSRFNRMYVAEPSTDRPPTSRRRLLRFLRKRLRVVETVVHESVHLLASNTSVHRRQADTPLWYSEGLAVWFEPCSGRGRLLWTGPGGVSAVHGRLVKQAGRADRLPVPVEKLLRDNRPFQDADQVASAYASSWALIYWLLRRDPDTFAAIARSIRNRPLLRDIPPDEELAIMTELFHRNPAELEKQIASLMRRLRTR